ncbi:MAG: hypothetical protein JWO46_2564 [Nocardioidaceae bacterium]|nr:hypothetical protein [Nocardioidaceae bacterium]
MRQRIADVLWVVLSLAVLGVVAALVWWKVVTPPTFQRTDGGSGAVMDQLQLGRRIKADGWFSVIGLVAALGAGFALTGWRRRDPLLVVVLGTLASAGAGYLAMRLGMALGHHDVAAEVRNAAVGARVPDSLMLISRSVLLVWPIGYLAAAMAVLLSSPIDEPVPQPDDEVAAQPAG